MTAVLQATDVLRMDRTMVSIDDIAISYSNSPADYKTKFEEASALLESTRQELEEFQQTSKEIEYELERDLERYEKEHDDLRRKLARSEQDREEWKSKFMALQTTHNMTTTSLQRELDTLRQEHQKTKIQMRELEMGNDDLERNERAISSSLQDVEGKYARVLEEKILLEHELLDKAHIEEDSQRLKDELRDANEEINILKEQLATARSAHFNASSSEQSAASTGSFHVVSQSEDNLLSVSAPPDINLSDSTPNVNLSDLTPVEAALATPAVQLLRIPVAGQRSLQHAGPHVRSALSTPPSEASPSLMRASTIPGTSTPMRSSSLSGKPAPTRLPPPPLRRAAAGAYSYSAAASGSIAGGVPLSGVPLTATKSKGVQMVSDMRARVKVLEQKIHDRVPRFPLMGNSTNRPSTRMLPILPQPKAGPSKSSSPVPSTALSSRSNYEERNVKSRVRRSADAARELSEADDRWILILEGSPSPVRDREKEKRRTSSPIAPSSFRPVSQSSSSDTPSTGAPSTSSHSVASTGLRRPQSRLSISTEGRSSVSTIGTASTVSSIPTPTSRPATPTHLPLPTSGMYAGTGAGLKHSTGHGSGTYTQSKRSSLGVSTTKHPSVRPLTKITTPGSQVPSRIGKPAGGHATVGRRSGDNDFFGDANGKNGDKGRLRSSSATASYGRNP